VAQKFDPKNFKKLDSAERRNIMPPRETLVKLGLRIDDVFVDIGCGTGYFTIPVDGREEEPDPATNRL
jgi:trans-aconitate methyltransferase